MPTVEVMVMKGGGLSDWCGVRSVGNLKLGNDAEEEFLT